MIKDGEGRRSLHKSIKVEWMGYTLKLPEGTRLHDVARLAELHFNSTYPNEAVAFRIQDVTVSYYTEA